MIDPVGWTLIPNFGHDSREFFCSVTGQQKRPEDPGVYRGPLIEMEGFFDICHGSAVQLGRLAGLVDADEAEFLQAEVDRLTKELADAERTLKVADAALQAIKELEEA